MNGVDYTKQLAKDREYFQDTTRKTNEAAEKRIEATNKRADHVMEKQRENFIEDRAELESTYQNNLENLKEKSHASVQGSNSKFNEQLEKERQSFTEESVKKSRDFDQRLNDIKSSYTKAFDSEKDRNEDLTNTLNNKYSKNVSEIKTDSEEKLKNYQERMAGTGENLKDQYNRERQQLVRAQEDRLTEAYKDSAHKRAELKERISTEAKKVKQVQTAETEHQRQYNQDRLSRMQDKYQTRFDAISEDYSQRNADLVKSQQKNAVKTNREHQEKVADIRGDYNNTLRSIELEKRRRDNGSGEFSEVVKKQQGLKDQIIQENKIKHLKGELVEAQRGYQYRADQEHTASLETLKKQASEATTHLDRKLNEANANKIVTVAHEREKAEAQVQNRDHQNRLDKSAYEQQLMVERNNANTRIDKLKESFHSSMKILEEKNQASLEDVTKVTNNDKAAFMKKVQENRSQELFEMKREFSKMMDGTVQDYEKRIANYQRDNEYLKMTMNQKVANIIDQTEKQLNSQRTLFEDRRAADIKGQQLLMDQRENQLKKKFSEMNHSYQKKIDKMQITNDTKLKLITNDYESKLKELKALTSKELAQKDTTQQVELERLKQAYEAEKTRVVNAYESQIENLKQGHKDQMSQMNDYKRLS
ncbi:MAG: hypothetical protein NDI69_13755 [Bacteriovoracaceae bacterium]|nr:hypothetical protein [Bacteriovoracaceae bacterium]